MKTTKKLVTLTSMLVFFSFIATIGHGGWFDQFEIYCYNAIDDDIDTDVDFDDSDCSGYLQGKITNENGEDVIGAKVEIRDSDLTVIETGFTNSSGEYKILVQIGTYTVVVTSTGYVPGTFQDINVPPFNTVIFDIEVATGDVCESDCTLNTDNIINPSCDGVNGCTFYDETSKAACEFAQPGWVREYSPTESVICPDGEPFESVQVGASITCSEDNLIKVTKVVNYQGKLVKLVVVTCG